jgi:hypothetical protein
MKATDYNLLYMHSHEFQLVDTKTRKNGVLTPDDEYFLIESV